MLHLKTCGGLSVEAEGASASGAAQRRKTLALLALLAAAGRRGMSRDKLITYLWPDADVEHGRNLLNQACYALRRDLHAPELILGEMVASSHRARPLQCPRRARTDASVGRRWRTGRGLGPRAAL